MHDTVPFRSCDGTYDREVSVSLGVNDSEQSRRSEKGLCWLLEARDLHKGKNLLQTGGLMEGEEKRRQLSRGLFYMIKVAHPSQR